MKRIEALGRTIAIAGLALTFGCAPGTPVTAARSKEYPQVVMPTNSDEKPTRVTQISPRILEVASGSHSAQLEAIAKIDELCLATSVNYNPHHAQYFVTTTATNCTDMLRR